MQLLAAADAMAPIPSTIESAFNARSILDPAVKEISTLLHRLGIVHDHPDFGDGDIPGEGGPGGGIGDGGLIGEPTDAQRSGILVVLMMFGIMAVMFTIVTGWIWCVAAREPAYYTVRESRKGQSKTKKVPFKGNYGLLLSPLLNLNLEWSGFIRYRPIDRHPRCRLIHVQGFRPNTH